MYINVLNSTHAMPLANSSIIAYCKESGISYLHLDGVFMTTEYSLVVYYAYMLA